MHGKCKIKKTITAKASLQSEVKLDFCLYALMTALSQI